jgi:hypothetical protein
MISRDERRIVEAVKSVPSIVIHFHDKTGTHDIEIKDNITKHDIAIALQSYFNRIYQ